MNNWGFVFEGIWYQKLSPFHSQLFIFGFTWNCCRLLEAKKFSSILLEKPDITCRGTVKTESLESSCRISPRPRTVLKILYFSRGHQFFQISRGIKSLYDRGRKLIHLLAGEKIWANLLTREATGVHLTRALGQGVKVLKTPETRRDFNGLSARAALFDLKHARSIYLIYIQERYS